MNEQLEQLTAMMRRTTFKDWLALVIVIACFAFMYLLLKVAMPEKNEQILLIAVGHMFGMVTIIVGFYFGSSKDKSDTDKSYNIQRIANASSSTEAADAYASMGDDALKELFKAKTGSDAPADYTKAQIIEGIKKVSS